MFVKAAPPSNDGAASRQTSTGACPRMLEKDHTLTMDKMIMSASIDSICRLNAADIMTQPVQVARDTWSVKMLLDFFAGQRISGAPVIATDGALCGVVSVTDVLRFENLADADKERMIGACGYSDYAGYELSPEDLHRLTRDADVNCPVSQIMTPRIITVEEDTPVTQVARLLRQHRIHRVFVLQDQKPVGVISTSNLLDVLINACDCRTTD